MAQETPRGTQGIEQTKAVRDGQSWQHGVEAGLIGGLVMGVLFSLLMPPVIENAIPALVGLSSGLVGWAVHMSISAVFGVVFAAALTQPRLATVGESVGGVVGFGLGYGAVLWIVAAGVVMPLWLSAVGFPNPPPLPNLAVMGLLTHLVFGLVLGVSYHYLR
ncbi:histidine kinase [Haloarcula sp. Atlit-7R]|uniref:histidine kinase n=1 Tax=Haloarcula sp. Atlit-7R TaxID=2282125 RepID=UPI000EF14D61|nr:histidine kinase [Haloarcula sp. Atlit-7R]RLM88456.1 histidine kinase [Haloarcula sp. Atlit-7R]